VLPRGYFSKKSACLALVAGIRFVQRFPSELDLLLLQLLDEEYTRHPFYGSRRMTKYLHGCGHAVNRKRVRRLMQTLGLAGMAPGPIPASSTCSTKFILTCSEASISTGPVRCGALTSLTLDCRAALSIWSLSSTGTAVKYWHGGYRTRWMPASVWTVWKPPSKTMERRRSLILIKARSLPAKSSPAFCATAASPSAWMDGAAHWTIFLSNGYGGR